MLLLVLIADYVVLQFFSSLVIFSYHSVCPVCFYGLLPDSNK